MACERCASHLSGELYAKAFQGPDALRKNDKSHACVLRLAAAFKDTTIMSLPVQRNSGHQAGNSSAHYCDFHAAPPVRPRLFVSGACLRRDCALHSTSKPLTNH